MGVSSCVTNQPQTARLASTDSVKQTDTRREMKRSLGALANSIEPPMTTKASAGNSGATRAITQMADMRATLRRAPDDASRRQEIGVSLVEIARAGGLR